KTGLYALALMSLNQQNAASPVVTTTTATGAVVESSTTSSGSAKIPANTPVGRQVKVEANTKVEQTISLSNTSALIRQVSSQAIIKLNMFKKDGSPVTGCAEVTSSPGATKVTLSCTVSEAGEYIIQLTTTAAASITFEAPVGGTVIASADSQGLVPISAIFSGDPTYETTKNILLGGILSDGMTVITIYKYDTTAKVLVPYGEADVKITFKDKPETTLNYGTDLFPGVISGFAGYNNTASTNIPGYYDQNTRSYLKATGGDTLRIKIIAKDNSFSIDKTVTYPNSISNIKLGGVALVENVSVTVSRAAGVEVSWDIPASNAPEFVMLSRGHSKVADFPKIFSVPAAAKSYKYSSAELIAYTTLSSENSTDNCLGVSVAVGGNQIVFPAFFNGEAKLPGATELTLQNSSFLVNNMSTIPTANYNAITGACESGVTAYFSGGGIGTSYPKLVITE
ncbi:MAG: hypothetical protein KDK45_18410, partial [Leptospiraceae bacterium]|nr:hypothetical protein [Leptospiraceae bacterium]